MKIPPVESGYGSWVVAGYAAFITTVMMAAFTFFFFRIIPLAGFHDEIWLTMTLVVIVIGSGIFQRGQKEVLNQKNPRLREFFRLRGFSIALGDAAGVFLGTLFFVGFRWALVLAVVSFIFDRKD